MDVSFAGRKLTLADLRKVSNKASEVTDGVKGLKNDFGLCDAGRRDLTLADLRKVSKDIPSEQASEFKAGGLTEVVKDLKNDFWLHEAGRRFAIHERPNISRQLRTDIFVTGGTTKPLNDVSLMKGDLELCGEWAPWSQVYKIMNK